MSAPSRASVSWRKSSRGEIQSEASPFVARIHFLRARLGPLHSLGATMKFLRVSRCSVASSVARRRGSCGRRAGNEQLLVLQAEQGQKWIQGQSRSGSRVGDRMDPRQNRRRGGVGADPGVGAGADPGSQQEHKWVQVQSRSRIQDRKGEGTGEGPGAKTRAGADPGPEQIQSRRSSGIWYQARSRSKPRARAGAQGMSWTQPEADPGSRGQSQTRFLLEQEHTARPGRPSPRVFGVPAPRDPRSVSLGLLKKTKQIARRTIPSLSASMALQANHRRHNKCAEAATFRD